MKELGQRVVDHIFDRMKIDTKWSVRKPGEFTWWGGPLAQRVWCDPPVDDDGITIHRIHARTDVARGYSGRKNQIAMLGFQSRMATTSSLVRSSSDPSTIQLASSVSLHDQTENWGADLMAWATAIQVTEAHLNAPIFTTMAECEDASTEHPSSGARGDFDDMLNVIRDVVAPLGEAESAWAGEEMMNVLEALKRPPCVLVTGDETGLAAEFPFGDQTSLLRIMTRERNPRMGNGVLMTLSIPALQDAGPSSQRWLELNELEASAFLRSHFLGTWCPDDRGPTFVSFFPNAVYTPGSLLNFAFSAIGRATWVSDQVYGHEMHADFPAAFRRKMEMHGIDDSED